MKKLAAFLALLLLSAIAGAQTGGGVTGTGVEGTGQVDCAQVYGPPCGKTASSYDIDTEAGLALLTESSLILYTEAAP